MYSTACIEQDVDTCYKLEVSLDVSLYLSIIIGGEGQDIDPSDIYSVLQINGTAQSFDLVAGVIQTQTYIFNNNYSNSIYDTCYPTVMPTPLPTLEQFISPTQAPILLHTKLKLKKKKKNHPKN